MTFPVDLYAVGSSLVDIEFEVSEEFLRELKLTQGEMTIADEPTQRELLGELYHSGLEPREDCGGSAVNTLTTAVAMGASGRLATRLCSDRYGEIFYRNLMRYGIECGASAAHPGDRSGTCVALITPDAERTMSTDLGINTNMSVADLRLSIVAESRYVYAEGYLVFIPAMVEALAGLELLEGQSLVLSLSDPSVASAGREAMLHILEHNPCEWLFGNEDEFLLLTGADTLEAAERVLQTSGWTDQYVVTCGARGAVVGRRGGESVAVAGEAVKPVDTLGAGDCFAGAFMYALIRGCAADRAAQFANTCSASLVQQHGPRLSLEECVELAGTLD